MTFQIMPIPVGAIADRPRLAPPIPEEGGAGLPVTGTVGAFQATRDI
jgi:hypothetical protein